MNFFSYFRNRPIHKLLDQGKFEDAAKLLIIKNEFDQAIAILEQGKLFIQAANLSIKRKDYPRAISNYLSADKPILAAEIYLTQGNFADARQICQQHNRLQDFGQLLFRRQDYLQSAKIFIETHAFEAAAKALLKAGRLTEAATNLVKAYEDLKQDMRGPNKDPFHPETKRLGVAAARVLEHAKQYRAAATILTELQLYEQAADLYALAQDFKQAAILSEDFGFFEKAGKYWALSGDTDRSTRLEAERLAHEGELLQAVHKFIQAKNFQRAGDLLSDLGDTHKAALMYEKAGNHHLAGTFYRQARQYDKAADNFDKAGDMAQAIDCLQNTSQLDRELSLRKQLGDFLGISKRLADKGNWTDAFQILDTITSDHPQFKQALTWKAKASFERGDIENAQIYLAQAVNLSGEVTELDALLPLLSPSALSSTDHVGQQRRHISTSPNQSERSPSFNHFGLLRDHITPQELPSVEAILHSTHEQKNSKSNPRPRLRYLKLSELGRGGMGVVFKAKDTTLDRIVAFKTLPSSLNQKQHAIHTFLREAQAAARLSHPNIVTVFDTGVQDGDYYIAMEYIDGQTLKHLLQQGKRFSFKQALVISDQLLDGVCYAHQKNVVHRDLTTNNIMHNRKGHIKIMDFGLAKIIDELLSEQSIMGGTPSYMSPEQTVGDPIDHRTDIYSLGITMFELFLGQLPFQKGDLGYHHVHTPPPEPRTMNPDIPLELSSLLLKCLEKKPSQRFQSAVELQTQLKRLQF